MESKCPAKHHDFRFPTHTHTHTHTLCPACRSGATLYQAHSGNAREEEGRVLYVQHVTHGQRVAFVDLLFCFYGVSSTYAILTVRVILAPHGGVREKKGDERNCDDFRHYVYLHDFVR